MSPTSEDLRYAPLELALQDLRQEVDESLRPRLLRVVCLVAMGLNTLEGLREKFLRR